MSEQESQRETDDREGEDRGVESAAPPDEAKVVGEGAEVPAGKGEEADEAGVEGGKDATEGRGDAGSKDEAGDEERGGAEGGREADDDEARDRKAGEDHAEEDDDDRDELAREIESDPASNPEDPMLKEIKGG